MVFSTSKLVALSSDLEVTLVKPILPYSVANNIINSKHAYYSAHAGSSSFEMNARYWAVTAPWDHVMMGKSHSITQANHGKAHALKRMKEGDWIVYYSPKMSFSTNWKCQRFTAMARVLDDEIFQVQLSNGFAPFRRRVEFIPCREVHIKPLIPLLSFIKNKESWGFSFKFGVIEIPQEDFSIIAKNMLETPNRTHSRGGAFLG